MYVCVCFSKKKFRIVLSYNFVIPDIIWWETHGPERKQIQHWFLASITWKKQKKTQYQTSKFLLSCLEACSPLMLIFNSNQSNKLQKPDMNAILLLIFCIGITHWAIETIYPIVLYGTSIAPIEFSLKWVYTIMFFLLESRNSKVCLQEKSWILMALNDRK